MRVAYVVNNAAFFVSHRLPIASAAVQSGNAVQLFTGQAGSATLESTALAALSAAAIPHTAVVFRSGGMNVIRELTGFVQLVAGLRRFRPDIVHCASPKGVLYGGLAARIAGAGGLVLAVSGMGYLFTGSSRGIKALLQRIYAVVVRMAYAHPNKVVIVQNHDDLQAHLSSGLATKRDLVLIPGSGVKLSDFPDVAQSGRRPLVVLPARLLKDKGVVEFVSAARQLRAAGSDWTFALVGTADYQNPSAVAPAQIHAWVGEGIIEWWGHREDMANVLSQASIVCLPSYREGLPKALLEAAAAGCAVVTTDVIGCREAVKEGETGDLVPPRDVPALADALGRLMADPARRHRYGTAGRRWAIERFGQGAVIERTLSIYQELKQRAI